MKKRILAIILCLAMVFTSGTFAFATDILETAQDPEMTEATEECIDDSCEDCNHNYVRPVFYSNAAKYIETIKEPAIAPFALMKTMILKSTSKASEEEPEESKVVLDKYVTENADGSYTITLESYVTGSKETIKNIKKIPSDIVLVLDESGSMDNCIVCGKEKSKCIAAYGEDGYKEIYADDMNPSEAGNYYYKLPNDDEYYPATYCNKEGCSGYGKWFQRANNHKDGGDHNSGSVRAPKTSASDTNAKHYQYYVFTHKYSERYASLENAVTTFLNSVYEDAKGDDGVYGTSDDVTHRVSIVGFGTKGHLRSYVTNANANTGALGTGWKGATTGSTAEKKADNEDDYDGKNGYLHLSDWLNEDGKLNSSRSRYMRMLRWANNTTEQGRLTEALNAATMKLDNGSTYTELGLDAARAIFAFSDVPYEGTSNPTVSKDVNGRNRVVVMFTDGAPTHGSAYFSNANTAISYANDLKNKYDATVYTVGIFSGADASNPKTLPTYYDYSSGKYYPDSGTETYSDRGIKLANRFMHLVSSNYPNATAMENDKVGSINSKLDNDSYYLSAGDADELKQVFQRIYESISSGGTTSQLTSTAVVKDIVEDSFYIPEGASVEAYSVAYEGKDGSKDKWSTDKKTGYNLNVDRENNTVTVSGFNYKDNYVGLDSLVDNGETTYTPHGEKLVLKIKINAKPDFLGGDEVVTNKPASGIYTNSAATQPVERFPIPDVDEILKVVTPVAASKNIYISQQASIPDVINIGKFNVDGTAYTIDGINNEYVDIKYTIENNGETMVYRIPAGTKYEELVDFYWENADDIVTHPVLLNDTTYKINCDVISINDTTNDVLSEDKDITINVFKPEITFNDSLIYLGQTADYANNGGTTIVWKNSKGEIAQESMGDAPTLEYKFNPTAGAFKEDTSVQVSRVTAKKADKTGNMKETIPADLNVTSYTTFYRDGCSVDGCTNTSKTLVQDNKNFVVHVKSFDLVIEKEGADLDKDPNQTFVFNVVGPNNLNLDVAVVGNDSKTIKNLPVGEYTVTEVKDWSWRYNPTEESITVHTDTVMGKGEVMKTSFSNTRFKSYWLDGNAFIRNLFNHTSQGE